MEEFGKKNQNEQKTLNSFLQFLKECLNSFEILSNNFGLNLEKKNNNINNNSIENNNIDNEIEMKKIFDTLNFQIEEKNLEIELKKSEIKQLITEKNSVAKEKNKENEEMKLKILKFVKENELLKKEAKNQEIKLKETEIKNLVKFKKK